jgi:hypothetical protein
MSTSNACVHINRHIKKYIYNTTDTITMGQENNEKNTQNDEKSPQKEFGGAAPSSPHDGVLQAHL